jgi:aspartyl aminopeptidase
MINTVLYNENGSSALKSRGFSNIEEAKKWIDTKGNYYVYQNSRIFIVYEAVVAYKYMYDLM